MARIRGIYINLDASKERRRKIESHLINMGLENNYTRFSAVRGDPSEASKKGLKSGELGLWESWIRILNKEKDSNDNTDYIHIIEDDALICNRFLDFTKNITNKKPVFDLLFTDMYVNPNIYLACKDDAYSNKKENIVTAKKIYTGCTSSCLIHRSKIENINNALCSYFRENETILPIDNALRRLEKDKILNIYCTLPFITTVEQEAIYTSTIQEQTSNPKSITLSQELCTLLRQDLSTKDRPNALNTKILELMQLISKENNKNEGYEHNDSLQEDLIRITLKHEILRYKVQPRLYGEPDNKQKSE